ncbi:hypothetical protein DIPPA_10739 [Diplonema papillatum]|nr:hypothetical protein DIPPA_10739 [Diplonema papillatum]
MDSTVSTFSSFSPWTNGPVFGSSLTFKSGLTSFASKSQTCSLYSSMYDAWTRNVVYSLVFFFILSNISAHMRGIRPTSGLSKPSLIFPIMVCVFPDPVCPYAKRQTLNPWNTLSRRGAPMRLYTISWSTNSVLLLSTDHKQ